MWHEKDGWIEHEHVHSYSERGKWVYVGLYVIARARTCLE